MASGDLLPVKADGLIDLEDLKRAMDDKTILVSIMAANNEIGVLQPIREIGKLCHEKGVHLPHGRCSGRGKVPVDVLAMNIDLLSLSGTQDLRPERHRRILCSPPQPPCPDRGADRRRRT